MVIQTRLGRGMRESGRWHSLMMASDDKGRLDRGSEDVRWTEPTSSAKGT